MNKRVIMVIILMILWALLHLYQCNHRNTTSQPINVVSDTITYIDTITYYHPVPRDSVVVRYITERLPAVKQTELDSIQINEIVIEDLIVNADSVEVLIPITQKEYKGNEYQAWVSGYKPSLDSIFVFPATTVITNDLRSKQNRWGLGVQVGIGAGDGRIYPYIGVGVSYNLFTW